VEGTCNGRYGYIVAIVALEQLDRGLVQEGTGATIFHVRYKAILMKPFKNETVNAVIASVNKMGLFAMVGPLQVFISSHVLYSSI